jgi:hypothetical protein
MSRSTYKPWLRNLYVRRLYLVFVVPVALPVMLACVAIQSASEWIPELLKAWQPERLDKRS